MPKPKTLTVFLSIPTYAQWCKANGLDPKNDENFNRYNQWKANS